MFDIREPALLEHRRGYAFLRSGLVQESMTYWEATRTHAQGVRRLSPLAREQGRDHVLTRSRVRACTVGGQLLALPEQHVGEASSPLDELELADDIPLLVGKPVWESACSPRSGPCRPSAHGTGCLHDRPIRTDRLVIVLEGSYRKANMVPSAQENLERRVAVAPPAGTPLSPSRVRGTSSWSPTNRQTNGTWRTSTTSSGTSRRTASRPFHAEALSLDDRIRTIRATRCLVLPGGAGVASLVHRIGMPTGVVEILPSNKELVEPFAAWFCREFGLWSRAVVGSAVSSSGRLQRSTSRPSSARWTKCAPTSGPPSHRAPPRSPARDPSATATPRDTIVSGVRRGVRR